jgi:hypothetical protein
LGKAVRCPKCKATIPTQSASQPPASTVSPAPSSAGASSTGTLHPPAIQDASVHTSRVEDIGMTCPICLSAVEKEQIVHRCPDCDIVHHDECWQEIGGCGTFGCKQAPSVDKSDQSAQAPLTAWGDTKDCPVCGEKIKSIALRCRYCGAQFDSVDPLSAADLRHQFSARQRTGQLKTIVVMTFGFSLVGCLAPLTLIFALAYLLPRRTEIAKAGPLVSVLAWLSIIISSIFCVLMLLFYFISV